MKLGVVLLTVSMAGCASPYDARPMQPMPVYVAPIAPPYGTVYVQPRGSAPGPGWGWSYYPRHGYGWHHAEHGWRH